MRLMESNEMSEGWQTFVAKFEGIRPRNEGRKSQYNRVRLSNVRDTSGGGVALEGIWLPVDSMDEFAGLDWGNTINFVAYGFWGEVGEYCLSRPRNVRKVEE